MGCNVGNYLGAVKFRFDNTEVAFAHRTTAELRRARWMFGLIARPWMVAIGARLLPVALWLRLPIDWALRPVFNYFCGGETVVASEAAIEQLSLYGVQTVLDYSAEGQTGEAALDYTCEQVLATVGAADGDPRHAFAVFKVSGLSDDALLEKVSASADLNAHQAAAWDRVRGRVQSICEATALAGGRVMIDAEQTWLQGAIDALAEEMMAAFNGKTAVVFTTVQMYRHDRLAYVKDLIRGAETGGYVAGIKIVRGAYMEKERERAKDLGLVDPIQVDKVACDRDFDEAIACCLAAVDRVHFVCATHNESSSSVLAESMARVSLEADDARISFAQVLGMSDHISFNLAAAGHHVAKYVPYGPLREAIPYLLRRATENSSVGGQTSRELELIRTELLRRKSKN
jgi:proline dehydrogenase